MTARTDFSGDLFVHGLDFVGTASTTTSSTETALVLSATNSGKLLGEGRLAVKRGGLGGAVLWDTIVGASGTTNAPSTDTDALSASLVCINSGATGAFSVKGACVYPLANSLVQRDTSGHIFGQTDLTTGDTYSLDIIKAGYASTTNSDTSSSVSILLSQTLGTISGTATALAAVNVAGRGHIAIAGNGAGATDGGGSIDVEFRGMFNCSVTGTSAWSFPTNFSRISRNLETSIADASTSAVNVAVMGSGSATTPELLVKVIGNSTSTLYWNGLFSLSFLKSR